MCAYTSQTRVVKVSALVTAAQLHLPGEGFHRASKQTTKVVTAIGFVKCNLNSFTIDIKASSFFNTLNRGRNCKVQRSIVYSALSFLIIYSENNNSPSNIPKGHMPVGSVFGQIKVLNFAVNAIKNFLCFIGENILFGITH